LYGELQLWDFAEGKKLKTWRAPSRSGNVGGLVFSPVGKYLVLAQRGTESSPAVWEIATGRRLQASRAPECFFQGVGFQKGRVIAVGLRSQSLVAGDVLSGRRFARDGGHAAPVAGALARDGRISTASNDGRVITWDLSGKQLETLPEPSDRRG